MITEITPGNSFSYAASIKSPSPALEVLVIYETVFACLMVKIACDCIAKYVACPVNIFYCSYALLKYPDHHQFAQNKARDSDIILVANSEKYNLPHTVTSWLKEWLWQSSNEGKAMVGLFGLEKRDNLQDLGGFRYLKSQSIENGLSFFGLSFPLSSMGESESLSDFEKKCLDDEFVDFLAEKYPHLGNSRIA
jgi:hypothetical protein